MCSRSILEFNILNPPPNDVKFTRKKEVEEKYLEFRKDKSSDDIVKHIKDNIIKQKLFSIVKNDFPYNVPYDHYLLWINPKINSNISCDFILKYVENYFQNKDFICFENIDCNKSILEIRHFHIFL